MAMGSKPRSHNPNSRDGESAGKIFVGGLPYDTQYNEFNMHFGKYGEITNSIIMKDRYTGQQKGFGFITYVDPSVVDKVIQDKHVINGKQVSIERAFPKGSPGLKDYKTKKIQFMRMPTSVGEDEFVSVFSKYGKVVEHQIRRDGLFSGSGFVIFDSEEAVEEVLSNGWEIDIAGNKVLLLRDIPPGTRAFREWVNMVK